MQRVTLGRFPDITVVHVRKLPAEALLSMAEVITQQEISEDYPELTTTDIQVCFAYAADREKHLLNRG
ncbi:MAG: DUF433 domain-containing protein [Methylomarinum sp.]|nr:DUF433 domain-containing protein [Methylomarinum sp.]